MFDCKKIEITVSTNEVLKGDTFFSKDVTGVFNKLSDYIGCGGGNMMEVRGRFEEITESVAYQLNYYVDLDYFEHFLAFIEQTFNEAKLSGVKKVSVKSFDCGMHNILVGE